MALSREFITTIIHGMLMIVIGVIVLYIIAEFLKQILPLFGFISPEKYEEIHYAHAYKNLTGTVGTTETEINLGVESKAILIHNLSDTNKLYLVDEAGVKKTINPGAVLSLKDLKVSKIKLCASADNTPYEILVLY